MKRFGRAALALGLLWLSMAAFGQSTWPTRPIRLVVPFAAGGTTDFVARTVAQKISQTLGQPVVVDNRAGATGTIGADLVAKAAPDGYTLMLTDVTFTIVPGVASKVPYDPRRDFVPIALAIKVPSLVLIDPKLPVNSLTQLAAYARSNAGRFTYGSGGVGSPVHLAGAMLATRMGADMIHVAYKGAAPAISDVMSGQIQMVIPSMTTVLGFVKSGQLRALAITSSQRSPLLPEVPTVAQAGFANYDATSWDGFSAPAGTPRPIIDKLNRAINDALADPGVRDALVGQGAEIVGGTPEQFTAFISDELTKWAEVAKESHVSADIR